jgi:hypothetical protein
MSRHVGVVVILAACGGGAAAKHEAPPPKIERPANHCAEVAEHLLAAFAEISHHAPEPALAAAYRGVVIERCTQDVWGADAQACMLKPGTDLDACTQKLTPEQRGSFAEAAQQKLNAAGTAAKP